MERLIHVTGGLILFMLFLLCVAMIGHTFGLFKEYGDSAMEPRQQINRIITPARPTPPPKTHKR